MRLREGVAAILAALLGAEDEAIHPTWREIGRVKTGPRGMTSIWAATRKISAAMFDMYFPTPDSRGLQGVLSFALLVTMIS
jgi:hypothetical protein